jgi:hypothetical protein
MCVARVLSGLLLLALYLPGAAALRPKFSWDTLGNMTFFHACNESERSARRAYSCSRNHA